MSQYFIIGLTGHAGTGKDTVRAVLEESGFTGMAFADPIRGMLRELLTSSGISDCYMDERELKETIIPELDVSYRHMAQTLGTEWGRSLQSDLWLRLAGSFMDDLAKSEQASHFVISDVRFQNEADWVREHGGQVWRVTRPAASPVRDHVSEREVDAIVADWTLDNSGTLVQLREAIASLLEVAC